MELQQISVRPNEEPYIPLATANNLRRSSICTCRSETERKCEIFFKIVGGGLGVAISTWRLISAVNLNPPNYALAGMFGVIDIISLKMMHIGFSILRNQPSSPILR
ncbi:MAG: hypothetical protein H0X29_04180 [Parachlamydiaceae bacterium]|nr:hypothetical protein [Parachlamydiaceae bacterium]